VTSRWDARAIAKVLTSPEPAREPALEPPHTQAPPEGEAPSGSV
jgi:hypothetical protein